MPLRHVLLAVTIAVVWGANLVVVKIAMLEMPPLLLLSLRFGLIALVLLPWLKIIKGQMVTVLLISVLAGALHFGASFIALMMADDVSSVAIATQLNVPIAAVLAVIFLGERIRFWRISGLVLAFSGVMVLGFDPQVMQYVEAMFVMAFSAFVYAVATILMRKINGVGVFELQVWLALVSVPFLAGLSFVYEPDAWRGMMEVSWIVISAICFSAFGASILGHGGFYFLLQRHSVISVAPFALMAPVFGIALAILMLDEHLTIQMTLGGLMTLIGVTIITLRSNRLTPPVSEEPIPEYHRTLGGD